MRVAQAIGGGISGLIVSASAYSTLGLLAIGASLLLPIQALFAAAVTLSIFSVALGTLMGTAVGVRAGFAGENVYRSLLEFYRDWLSES